MVKCIFAVQPISMEVFVRTYIEKFITPAGASLLMPMIKKWVICGALIRLGKMSPLEYVKDIKVPTMYVQARKRPLDEAERYSEFR